MYVDGRWVDARSGATLDAVDPTSENVIATFPNADAADVDDAVAAARDAASGWRDLGWARRAGILRELARRIDDAAEQIARIDVQDGGKLLTGMRKEVSGASAEILYYAGLAPQSRGSTAPPAPDTLSFTEREPYGVVGRIVPFNHPFKFAAGKVAAPLAAGNSVVLKPGEQTSLSALELARLTEGLLPPGVLNVVTGSGATTGAALVAHPDVPRIAFTGSVPTGQTIMRSAADHIKHISLELGGKNPIIVFPDADPSRAAAAAVAGMNIARSTGQSCGSTSRLFVHDDVRGPFLDALVARLEQLRIGDPMDEATDIGPLAFRAHHDRVMSCVDAGLREGATLLTGGRRPSHLPRGYFVEPAVFTDVDDGMTIATQEIFGPVMSVLGWQDVDDVVRRANALPLGLTANVWTNDVSAAHRTARALEAGYVYVNGTGARPTGTSFGGWKTSGIGKENSLDELLSYTREKTVTVTLL
jgi:betaine-aldehyde dehydrogenase